jgi:hypothetical protein
MAEIRICCPKCSWEPDGAPYWSCNCGTRWNTFATGGRCPGCGKVWEFTQCIQWAGGCDQWSPHLDWYENLDDITEEIRTLLKQPEKITDP